MKKTKVKIIFVIIFALVTTIFANSVSANYEMIYRGNKNSWIKFPDEITKSWLTSWDGYYMWSGNLENISTNDKLEFEIQLQAISAEDIQKIQTKSDETPDDSMFSEWLNEFITKKIDNTFWEKTNSLSFNLECLSCTSDSNDNHEHLIFIKITDNGKENILWQGYGNGFSRITQSRTMPKLQEIEVTKKPNKIEYEEGETFSKEGMEITAKYSNDTSKVVTDYIYSPKDILKQENDEITINYTENNITKSTSLKIIVAKKNDEEQTQAQQQNEIKENIIKQEEKVQNSEDPKTIINQVEDKNNVQEKNEIKDITISNQKLPNTGNKYIVIVAILSLLSIVCYILYKKYNKFNKLY